jgi:hypothetical protein
MAKRKQPTPRMTTLGGKVFAETAFFTGAGMQSAMGGRPYALTPEARDYWLDKHAKTIPIALKRKTADWETDRTIVIQQAINLGAFAAQFALKDAKPTGIVTVDVQHVQAASKKVNDSMKAASRKVTEPRNCGYC